MTQMKSIDIVNTPSNLEGKDEHKLEYIKMMISLVQEDMRNVSLYITAGLGLMVFALSQIELHVVISLPLWARVITLIGITMAASASFCFFLYIRSLHITRMKMTRCIVALDVLRTRELWAGEAGVWQKNKNKYKLGQAFIGMSVASFAIVVFYLLVIINIGDIPTN